MTMSYDLPSWSHWTETNLQKMKSPSLASVPGEGRGAGGVDAVDPVVQLHLARRLRIFCTCGYCEHYRGGEASVGAGGGRGPRVAVSSVLMAPARRS